MKTLPALLLLALVACSPQTELPPIPQPMIDGVAGDISAQIQEAHAAALATPEDADAVGRYGMHLQAFQQDKAALPLYERARALAPDEHRWQYYYAFLLESAGDTTGAIAGYQQALSLSPGYLPGQHRLADLLLKDGQHTEARRHYASILKANPTFISAAVGLAQARLAGGLRDDARAMFEQVLAREPTNARAHYALAQMAREDGESEKAEEYSRRFEQYRSIQPLSNDRLLSEIGGLNQSDQVSMQRAGHSLSRGDVVGAIAHFEEAIVRNPENTGARVSLVGLYAAGSNFEQAEKHYQDALPLAPRNAKLHFNHGLSHQLQGEHEKAIEMFGSALDINPNDADALAYLGVSQLATGEREAAQASLQRAVSLNPRQREANARLGQVLLEDGQASDAVGYLRSASRRDDRYSISYLLLLAQAADAIGDEAAATTAKARAAQLAQRFGVEAAEEPSGD